MTASVSSLLEAPHHEDSSREQPPLVAPAERPAGSQHLCTSYVIIELGPSKPKGATSDSLPKGE